MRYSVPYVYLVALCCSLGGFTFGYDVGIISGILPLPSFQRLVGITPQNTQDLSGSIAASLQVGGFVGVILQAFFNDWVGRKTSIQIFSLVFVIGAVIQTAATNIWWLYVGRFVSGSGTQHPIKASLSSWCPSACLTLKWPPQAYGDA